MQHKGFSPTTVILVIVLIAALFGVGKLVTPPPAGPPPAPAPVHAGTDAITAAPAAANKSRMDAMRRDMMTKMHNAGPENSGKQGKRIGPKPGAKKFDPYTIDVTPGYFGSAKQGSQGEQEMERKVAIATAERKAEMAKAALEAKAHPAPGAPRPGKMIVPE